MSSVHVEEVRILEEHGEETGRRINWCGMIFFISSEALIFVNLIAGYIYLEIRGQSIPGGQWLLPSGEHLDWRYPSVNTLILLASSLPAIWARAGIVKGN